MKFQNQKIFETHLQSLRTDSALFVLLVNEERERRDIAFRIKESIVGSKRFEVQSFTCGQDNPNEIFSAFHSLSLFSQLQVVEVNEAQLLNDHDLKALYGHLKVLPNEMIVIISSSKALPKMNMLPKDAHVLDLTHEKPWDHKKRVMALLFDYVKKAGKTIAYDAVEQLIDLVGIDYGKLMQQMEILICYVGDKKGIALEDLHSLSIAKKKQKTWQLAEYITWGEGADISHEGITDSDFISLINQIRFRLNVGIKIKEGIHPDDIAPSLLQKYLTYCAPLTKDYFKRALIELYDIERFSRSHQFSTSLLFDMLYMKLYDLREAQCPSPSQV